MIRETYISEFAILELLQFFEKEGPEISQLSFLSNIQLPC